MSVPADRPWPPIVSQARLPAWAVARDFVLTALLWGSLGYVVVTNLDVAGQALQLLGGGAVEVIDPLLAPFLDRMGRRVAIAATLVAILAITTVRSIRRYNRAARLAMPAPAADADLAAGLGLTEAEVAALRERRILVLDVDEQGRALLGEADPG